MTHKVSVDQRLTIEKSLEQQQGDLLKTCRYACRNEQDAMDVMQETLLKAYQHWDSFNGRSSRRTWLSRIAMNCSHDLHRRQQRARLNGNDRLDWVHLQIERQSESYIRKFDQSQYLNRLLRCLPDTMRRVIELRYFRDYELLEIAEEMHISLSAVKMRLYRALELLREAWSTRDNCRRQPTRSHQELDATDRHRSVPSSASLRPDPQRYPPVSPLCRITR